MYLLCICLYLANKVLLLLLYWQPAKTAIRSCCTCREAFQRLEDQNGQRFVQYAVALAANAVALRRA